MRSLIAIVDLLTNEITGPVIVMPGESDAPAIRWFSDVARAQDSQVGRHLEDYVLVNLATLDPDWHKLTVTNRVIVSGKAWLAAQSNQSQGE